MQVDSSDQLNSLPIYHALAFIASCGERMFPNYLAFAQMQRWGDPNVLRSGLDTIWSLASGKDLQDEYVRDLHKRCEATAPDSEQFNSLLTAAAQYAVTGVLSGLDCYLQQDVRLAQEVSVDSLETVRDYLYRINCVNIDSHAQDMALEEWIETAPLFQAERVQQEEDIALLKSGLMSTALLNSLRQPLIFSGIRPLDRGIYSA